MKTCRKGHPYEPDKNYCSECKNLRHQKWKEANPEKVAESQAKYSQTHREQINERTRKYLAANQEYRIWIHMKRRCLDTNDAAYSRYGGRGIGICDRWMEFNNFLLDMGPRPSKDYSVERTDNNVGYQPDNCKWGTDTQQARNRKTNLMFTHNGETRCLTEWAEVLGIDVKRLRQRIRRGWSFEDAIA